MVRGRSGSQIDDIANRNHLEECRSKLREAVDQGKVVVIDRNGQLAWSNGVPVGQTGHVQDGPLPGKDPHPHGDGAKS